MEIKCLQKIIWEKHPCQQIPPNFLGICQSPQGVLLRMERLLSKHLSGFAASRSRAATFEDAAERRVKAMQRYLGSQTKMDGTAGGV